MKRAWLRWMVCCLAAWGSVSISLAHAAPPKKAVQRPAATKPASKGPNPRVGPGKGAGQRRLEPPPVPGSTLAAEGAHRVGRPPKQPSPTLPPDVERSEPSERARRSIAGGATSADLQIGTDDPELRALREAERALFPHAPAGDARGLEGGLPVALDAAGPDLSASGLPLSAVGARRQTFAEPEPLGAWPSTLALPNLPVVFERRTLGYMKFYRDTDRGRSIAQQWARKMGRYTAALQTELARAGLPTDLVWLSLIESGHNPTIRSPVGAAGLWQFMPESARLYGLTVDRWVDERLDPLRSTQAAIRYLSDLKSRFGTWDLAMAAYNMGHFGLTRVITKYNSNDFWRLSRLEAALPWETALYVPKILAIAVVMRNKAQFGLADVPPDPPVSFDTVYLPSGVPLDTIAEQAGISRDALESLNPQLLSGLTPPAEGDPSKQLWPVHVPRGSGDLVAARFAKYEPATRARLVRARQGDTWETIAYRCRASEDELRAHNRARSDELLVPGSLLLVPPSGAPDKPPPDVEDVIVSGPERFRYEGHERVFYRVVAGDDLAEVARAFRVDAGDLVLWNALDERASLQVGMVLQLFVPEGVELSGVRFAREEHAGKRLLAGSTSFIAHFEGEQGRQRLELRAREGETLASIGRRYGLSAGMMERINHFWRGEVLNDGAPVVVYAKHGPQLREMFVSRAPDPLPPLDPPHPTALPNLPARAE
jgi:membrane-bound lytic murein transglycosylase D